MADPTPDTTLLDRTAQAIAKECFAASLVELTPAARDEAYRRAGAALSELRPELDRLAADNELLSEELGDLRVELARRAGVAPGSDFGEILRSLDLMHGGPGFTHEKHADKTGVTPLEWFEQNGPDLHDQPWTPNQGEMVVGEWVDDRSQIIRGAFRYYARSEAVISTSHGIRYAARESLRPAPQTEQETNDD
jgi:hypothetical protein